MGVKNIKILKSGFWFTISSVISLIVGFLQTFFLAKFLSNEVYGIYSLVLIVITMFDSFSEFGVKDALIRQKNVDNDKLYTAFWMEFFRNILCLILLISLSWKISQYYNIKILSSLIIIISFKFLFNGLKNINIFTLYRTFETKKLIFIQQIPIIITTTLSIFVAYYTKNLVYICFVILLGDFLSCVISYLIKPAFPKFKFKMKDFKELLPFCFNIFMLTTLGYLLRQIDYLFVSKFSGVVILGLYTLAYKVTNIVVTNLSYVINNVTYPLYSQIKKQEIKKYFSLFNELVIYVYILFSFSILFYMRDIISFIYKNKWNNLYEVICALLAFAFFRMVSSMQGSIYKTFNKPQIDNKLSIIELIFICILIYPMYRLLGLYGVILTITIAIIIRFLISSIYLKNLIHFNYIKDLKYKTSFILILYSLIINYIFVYLRIKLNLISIIGLIIYFMLYIVLLIKMSNKNIKLLIRAKNQ